MLVQTTVTINRHTDLSEFDVVGQTTVVQRPFSPRQPVYVRFVRVHFARHSGLFVEPLDPQRSVFRQQQILRLRLLALEVFGFQAERSQVAFGCKHKMRKTRSVTTRNTRRTVGTTRRAITYRVTIPVIALRVHNTNNNYTI